MFLDGFLHAMGQMKGITRVFVPDMGLLERIRSEEDTVTCAAGGFRYNPVGLVDCMGMGHTLIAYCNQDFDYTPMVRMELVDDFGVIIGHNVGSDEKDSLSDNQNVLWISDSFVMYSDRITCGDAEIRMHSRDYDVSSVCDGLSARMYFPSMTSCGIITDRYGGCDDGSCIAVVGIDGLEGSVPVSDVVEIACGGCSHRESSPEDALD